MSAGLILFIVGIVFLIVLLSGFPLAFTLGGLGVIFAATLWGNPAALNLFIASATTTCVSNVYVAVPLFIFMGAVIEASGSADDLFESMYIIFGKISHFFGIFLVYLAF